MSAERLLTIVIAFRHSGANRPTVRVTCRNRHGALAFPGQRITHGRMFGRDRTSGWPLVFFRGRGWGVGLGHLGALRRKKAA
jgi:hypothetical protein